VLIGPEGDEVDLQTQSLARWSDGSVKWLLLDFFLSGHREGTQRWEIAVGPSRIDRDGSRPSHIQESAQVIAVQTGTATFQVNRDHRQPLLQTVLADQGAVSTGWSGFTLFDARGRAAEPRVEAMCVETRGPVRTTVRVEGHFAGHVPCRFVARFCFFAGTGLVRLRLTLHNPGRARHPGGLWDLGDPGSYLFRGLGVRACLDDPGPTSIVYRAEADHPFRSTDPGAVEIYQDSSGGEHWRSRTHVNRQGRVPCAFRGYRVRDGGGEAFGLRASPVVSVQGSQACLTAAVPEFWPQFPKAIEVSGRTVEVGLFPKQFADLHELQGGERKAHTVWFDFDTTGHGMNPGLDWVDRPADARATPEWYAASEAIPDLLPATDRPDNPLDRLLDEANGADGFIARREVIDEYGWRNFGEIYADHEAAYYQGPPPVISHYNNQYDMIYGFILQYLRTGDPRWGAVFGPLARHVIDIDIYHTEEDRAAYNGGLFWFTDHYKDAATSTHRTYSRMNSRPGDRSYGGGPSSNHNFATGLLHYYFLTGDPEGRDAAVGLADWVIAMDDGQKTLLGIVDRTPTGLASFTADLGYHGPGRGCGNSVAVLLDAWLATGRRVYLEKAEELIRRSVHPADEVAARDLLNVEARWSYTVFLAALARYLDIKAEAGELDFTYAYARASLNRYALWMLEHEEPYFDHPEKLEYPTEAWAAQELRKANVLRLAARHADEAARPRLLRRGDELAGRAWGDLRRFATRTTARALAIAMVEGTRDVALQGNMVAPSPAPAGEHDFGAPEAFIPQKYRILAGSRAVRALVRTLWRIPSRTS
jgi:hypothetical protein